MQSACRHTYLFLLKDLLYQCLSRVLVLVPLLKAEGVRHQHPLGVLRYEHLVKVGQGVGLDDVLAFFFLLCLCRRCGVIQLTTLDSRSLWSGGRTSPLGRQPLE